MKHHVELNFRLRWPPIQAPMTNEDESYNKCILARAYKGLSYNVAFHCLPTWIQGLRCPSNWLRYAWYVFHSICTLFWRSRWRQL